MKMLLRRNIHVPVLAIALVLSGITWVSSAVCAPAINLSRSAVAFGFSPTAVTAPVQPVVVTNVGDAPLSIASLTVSGAQASDFRVSGTCSASTSLSPNAQCRIDILLTIASGSPSTRSATLTLQSDASPSVTTITLTGLVDPGLGDTALLPSPTSIQFAPQPIGVPSATTSFILTNNAPVVFTVTGLQLVGGNASDFSFTASCSVGQPFPASRPCDIEVAFTPQAAGPRSTELQIQVRTDIITGTFRYSITGVGGDVNVGAAVEINQPGITGSWYQPSTSGQGFEIEIFPDLIAPGTGYSQLSWFTFDTVAGGSDHQRWFTLSGPVVTGQANASLVIYQNVGGNFDAAPVTSALAVGTATLNFDSCSTGRLVYSFTDGTGRAGTIPLTRLTKNVTCTPGGTSTFDADFAHSGNWFAPATSGQGFSVELNSESGILFLAWYTYAPNGAAAGVAGQRWYTGQASTSAGLRTIPFQLYETTGGVFDSSVMLPQTIPVGTGVLTFSSCSSATLSYAFTAGSSSAKSGTITLSRPGPVPAGCTS